VTRREDLAAVAAACPPSPAIMATSTVPLWQRDLQQQLDYRDQTQYRNLATLIETCAPCSTGDWDLYTTLIADPPYSTFIACRLRQTTRRPPRRAPSTSRSRCCRPRMQCSRRRSSRCRRPLPRAARAGTPALPPQTKACAVPLTDILPEPLLRSHGSAAAPTPRSSRSSSRATRT